jgi:hypothetical protein
MRQNRAMMPPSVRRLLLLLLAILAVMFYLRRSAPFDPPARAGGSEAPGQPMRVQLVAPPAGAPVGLELDAEHRRQLVAAARALAAGRRAPTVAEPSPAGPRLVAISWARPAETARVGFGTGATLGEALAAAVASASRFGGTAVEPAALLKLDVLRELSPVQAVPAVPRFALEPGLEGLWLPDRDLWLLPDEIEARAIVTSKGRFDAKRLARHLRQTGREETAAAWEAGAQPNLGARFLTARFDSFFAEPGRDEPIELYRGNRAAPPITPEALLAVAREGGDYLASHLDEKGRFDYLYLPYRDRVPKGYNLLRHAGSCYALFELYGATKDPRYRAAGEKGIEHLLSFLEEPRPEHAGAGFLTLATGGEAKLGGAALALLATLEHGEVTGERPWRAQEEKLARFLIFLQEASGRFESKYWYGPPGKPFESIYYPGEAILALARLHQVDRDPRWLEGARKGAEWLIEVRDAGKATDALPHDHWLLMGLEELHALTGKPLFLAHGQRIAEAILGAQWGADAPFPDWQGGFYDPPRSTPTATRAEAMVAMVRLARANRLPTEAYERSLAAMAAYQLRTRFAPESVLYLARPDRALGGFRRSLTVDEIRIDYVQHNLSALLGLRGLAR